MALDKINKESNDKLVYTPDEVVRMLRLDEGKKDPEKGGRQALRVLVRRTGIRPAKIGYSYMYTEDDIDRLLDAARRQ